jgi:hypothetical protein
MIILLTEAIVNPIRQRSPPEPNQVRMTLPALLKELSLVTTNGQAANDDGLMTGERTAVSPP